MDDPALRARLDRLVPEPPAVERWDDVLRRAGRIVRRRRRRVALVAAAALVLTLGAALGAAGQLGSLLSHSAEPSIVVSGRLRSADGSRIGSFRIELTRVAIAFDGRRVRLWGTRLSSPDGSLPARWFLESAESGLRGTLFLRGERVAVLCDDCRNRDSGRLELSYAQASALVDGRLVFELMRDGKRVATARLVLFRTRLHKGLQCSRATSPRRCTSIYTGR
jgi:hypothetical protein